MLAQKVGFSLMRFQVELKYNRLAKYKEGFRIQVSCKFSGCGFKEIVFRNIHLFLLKSLLLGYDKSSLDW